MLATRLVHVQSIDNFRDLGGYITKDGKIVKWGYFYRCASLGKMSEDDKRHLEDIGIGTIFDFRSKIEVEGEPDIIPTNAIYINESGIRTMDDNFKGKENFDMKSVIRTMVKNPERIGEVADFLLDGYKTMAIHNNAFKELFNVIKDKNRVPLIFHCTAGKDRTGVGAALILLALGVSEEDVIKDYCLSNIYRKESNEKQIEGLNEFIKDEKVLEVIASLLSVKEEYIKITLDYIKQKYNSYEEYIINELNVTADELNNIRNNYLY